MEKENFSSDISNEYYLFAQELLFKQKKSFPELKKALLEKGLDDIKANQLIDELSHMIEVKKRKRADRDMVIGGLSFIAGVALTLSEIGYIFWGAIVIGGIQFARGVWRSANISNTSFTSSAKGEDTIYVLLEKFNTGDAAGDFVKILNLDSIDYIVEDTSFSKDVFGSSGVTQEFLVKVHKKDFDRAVILIERRMLHEIQQVEKDYHLFEYSNEELEEIITKKEEWSRFDVLLARKILKDRTHPVG